MKTNHVLGAFGSSLLVAISIFVCTSLIVLLGADSSMAMTDNLLENGGAESGDSDWQAWGHFESVSDRGTTKYPHGGDKFFYGGDDNEQSELYQDIDVSGYAEIDNPPSLMYKSV